MKYEESWLLPEFTLVGWFLEAAEFTQLRVGLNVIFIKSVCVCVSGCVYVKQTKKGLTMHCGLAHTVRTPISGI